VRKNFGSEVLTDEGKIDRAKLSEQIFRNPEKRRLLNKLSHPRIFRRIFVQLFKLRFIQRKAMVVLDAPLLFETKILQYVCYPIVVVYCEDT
jgi:dephospho-CoA kinase